MHPKREVQKPKKRITRKSNLLGEEVVEGWMMTNPSVLTILLVCALKFPEGTILLFLFVCKIKQRYDLK